MRDPKKKDVPFSMAIYLTTWIFFSLKSCSKTQKVTSFSESQHGDSHFLNKYICNNITIISISIVLVFLVVLVLF